MKKFSPTVIFSLMVIVLLASASWAQESKPSEGSATAYKTSEKDERKNQTGANEAVVTSQPVTNSSESSQASEAADNPAKSGAGLEAQKFYESGMSLYEAGKVEEAIDALKQADKLRPDDPQTNYGLGMAYSQTRSYKDAAESFKRALKSKPDWPEANFRMGMMSYVLGRRTQSVEAYNRLLKLNSPLANTLYRIIREDSSSVAFSENLSANSDQAAKPFDVLQVSNSIKENGPGTSSNAPAPAESNESSSPKPSGNGSASSKPDTESAAVTEAVGGTTDAPSPSAPVAVDQAPTSLYRVGVGDILDIRFINSTAPRSTLYTVIDGGIIDLPIAGGPVAVTGLTPEEIQNRIGAELKRRAVEVNAMVAVGVRQYASHSVIVTGLVGSAGTRFLRREAVPLYVIMAEAQPRLDAGQVTIMRTGGKGQTVDLNDSSALNMLVYSGDVINVGPRPQQFYYIGGRVNFPGQKAFQIGITLLQAILAAGGPAQNDNTIDLSREGVDSRLTTTRYNLREIKSGKVQDPKLQPGDRIEVVH